MSLGRHRAIHPTITGPPLRIFCRSDSTVPPHSPTMTRRIGADGRFCAHSPSPRPVQMRGLSPPRYAHALPPARDQMQLKALPSQAFSPCSRDLFRMCPPPGPARDSCFDPAILAGRRCPTPRGIADLLPPRCVPPCTSERSLTHILPLRVPAPTASSRPG